MLFIDLDKLLPRIRHLIPALKDAHEAIMRETDPAVRAELINKNSDKWTALRDEFSVLSHEKCWYIECRSSGADNDIDHFRPKNAVAGDPKHPGYYWLAFDWRNMRLSSQRANRSRRNPVTKQIGGKSSHFPLLSGSPRAYRPEEVSLERPALLDPTNETDWRLLTFRLNGEADLSPEYKGKPYAVEKFEASRRHLNLNWPKFVKDRSDLYTQIERIVNRGVREAPQDFDAAQLDPTAYPAWKDAIRDLRAVLEPEKEYCAAARVYVECFKHVWWVREIVLGLRS